MNHAQRVGKVANLVIFLGILGIILSILALTISQGLALRGYGFGSIVIGLLMMGLGYGIRYRYKYCLYAAVALFVTLSCSFLLKLFIYHTVYLIMRLVLCSWVSFRLVQSVSSLQMLIATDAFPDRNNRFISLLMRRKQS
ncbi:MAG: hypothetical protein DWB56_08435 [Candidatus Jettenia sp.]|uniref:Uncharacterized protein n=1 Tax=Candidatus Jettenia caeni TaxID=247490 RepID=I3IPX3_9BACT|nr:hypothetical protein [Candidatus Jettenia sp. AMX1]MBC6928970.1 hypothetical protein [Candidatus Jettenia sp.]WKZ15090.1 MAG: hypothetical protein QY317_14420 [Candidatus Jettenia caeni]KAA0250362.1 MAG: hypothetical protein EDM77_05355 [Candidatus Jettenia sp. AMX1]MCE7880895.1 hypothetical protein [Candidatus Jettenia sp. AMX1]MCQ3926985.1 hypothetical protein [Candidatus Jettenia sp.]